MAQTNSNRMGYNGGRVYSFTSKPVTIDCSFTVAPADSAGLGIAAGSLRGSGVQNVFMHTSATAGTGNNGYVNPNPAVGYALVQLNNNYNKFVNSFGEVRAPLSGSNLAINATALTIGSPYVISAVGHGSLGSVTIAPVADVSGSLASTWFRIYDNYGNTFIFWFQVSGVGSAPVGVSGTLVQVAISTNATAATIGTQLVTIINALAAQTIANPYAPSGVFSFTASGTTTVTVVSTQTNPYQPLPTPADGTVATGFTFANLVTTTNQQDWQKVGLPAGITPAVNAAFVATATGYSASGSSTGTVQLATVSTVTTIEVVGDPSMTLSPLPVGGSPNVGGFLVLQFLAATSSSVTTLIPAAPAVGSIVNLSIEVEAGSVLIGQE